MGSVRACIGTVQGFDDDLHPHSVPLEAAGISEQVDRLLVREDIPPGPPEGDNPVVSSTGEAHADAVAQQTLVDVSPVLDDEPKLPLRWRDGQPGDYELTPELPSDTDE